MYTSTERVVFPATADTPALTKGDVLAYYELVAPLMLPELRDRALTVERFTKGLGGGGFYQKHAAKHYPPFVDRFTVRGKTAVTYPVCNTAEALLYLANQNALAFHIMTARTTALAHPDLLVFDLDPPEGRFDLVRRAARLIRAELEAAGKEPFLKTSGSKGLHVVCALDGASTYASVEAVTSRIARALCEREPDAFTLAFYKQERAGRLFIDTMRNAPGATVVAPYSVRGRPGAPVSAPLTWDELDDPDLAPDGIRIPHMRARLARVGDPWARLRG